MNQFCFGKFRLRQQFLHFQFNFSLQICILQKIFACGSLWFKCILFPLSRQHKKHFQYLFNSSRFSKLAKSLKWIIFFSKIWPAAATFHIFSSIFLSKYYTIRNCFACSSLSYCILIVYWRPHRKHLLSSSNRFSKLAESSCQQDRKT